MFYLEFMCLGVYCSDVDVEPAKPFMPVGREVQVAVRPERREHFVAFRVDRLAQVLRAS